MATTSTATTTMTTIAAREAKNRFGHLIDASQREPIIIERHGRPVSVVVSKHDYDEIQAKLAEARGWAETHHLLSNEANRKHLLESIAQLDSGEGLIVKTMQELEADEG